MKFFVEPEIEIIAFGMEEIMNMDGSVKDPDEGLEDPFF